MKRRSPILPAAVAVILAAAHCGEPAGTPPPAPEPVPADLESAELDDAKKDAVWAAENATFQIETRLGKPFMQSLRERDVSGLAAVCRDGFAATVAVRENGRHRARAGVEEVRYEGPGGGQPDVDAVGLAEWLISGVADFEEIRSTTFRVLHIEPDASCEHCWRMHVLLVVGGRGTAGAPLELLSEHTLLCHAEKPRKMHEVPPLERWHVVSETVRRAPRLLMEEVTRASGLDAIGLPDNWKPEPGFTVSQSRFQPVVADYDGDDRLDIALATLEGRRLLLRGGADGRFEDVTERSGVATSAHPGHPMSYVAAWLDFDADGDVDLLLGTRLYRNDAEVTSAGGPISFTDVTAESGLRVDANTMGCIVADYDADGAVDLYMLYQGPAVSEGGWIGDNEGGAANQLWRGDGKGHFQDVTVAAGASGGNRHTLSAAWLHVDDDHFPDLYVVNDFGHNVMLLNRGDGTFEDATEKLHLADYSTSMGVAAGDLDGDGVSEIYVANMYSKMGRRIIGFVDEGDYPPGVYEQIRGSCAGNHLYRRGAGEERFHEMGEDLQIHAVGWAYAPAMVDIDGDGRLDLYSAAGFLSFERGKPDG